MWKAIGWLLVFLFPLVMVYLTGGPATEPLLDDEEYQSRKRLADKKQAAPVQETSGETTPKSKNKKKNKKSKAAITAPVEEVPAVVERAVAEPSPKKKNNKKKTEQKKQAETPKKAVETPKKEEPKKVQEEPKDKDDGKVLEIDEHMDPTAQYARVMRIRPEESDDEWEAIPVEEGWSQVKSRRPYNPSKNNIDVNAEINNVSMISNSPLDKKQRENLSRSQKKKAAKAEADRLQEERLRKHKKELEKIKIQEFYSSGKGKNTPWGKNGQKSSSKVPQSTASINEFGQLIWE